MDVKCPFRIAAAAVLIAMLSASSFCQTRPSSCDPTLQRPSRKRPDSFLDFTLKRVNPSDKNYGQCVDQGRAVLLEETIRNGYFWSNLIALGLLGCLLTIIIFQHRIGLRRESAAAELLAQFEQSLQRSNAQVDQATKRNHGFRDALATLRESTLRSAPLPPNAAQITASPVAKTRSNAARVAPTPAKTTSAKAATERNSGAAIAAEPESQMALFKSDAAVIMKINSLEQQLARSEEQQKELRRQLNDAGRKFQAEQEKNRALKGA
jgi:flagellar biosynthesis GTPase FlhF